MFFDSKYNLGLLSLYGGHRSLNGRPKTHYWLERGLCPLVSLRLKGSAPSNDFLSIWSRVLEVAYDTPLHHLTIPLEVTRIGKVSLEEASVLPWEDSC
jgi:hypothetical protein